MTEFMRPTVTTEEVNDTVARYIVEPLERGYGHTLGNSLRRVLLSSLDGAKATAIQIEGDVQLAADVNWLVDHVRWDVEDDLARIVGDAPAHALGAVARRMGQVLRQFVAKAPASVQPDGQAP